MSVRFHIFPDKQMVFVRYHGVATVQASAAAFASYMQHPDFRPGQKQLVDLSGLTGMEPRFPELLQLQASKAEAFVTEVGETLVVYHAPSIVTLKMARLIERSWESIPGVVIVVVQDEEAALEIMGLRETSFEALSDIAH